MHRFAWTFPTINLDKPSKENYDHCTNALQDLFRDILEATGKTRHRNGHSGPWGTKECKADHRAMGRGINGSQEKAAVKKQLKYIFRRSKRAHGQDHRRSQRGQKHLDSGQMAESYGPLSNPSTD